MLDMDLDGGPLRSAKDPLHGNEGVIGSGEDHGRYCHTTQAWTRGAAPVVVIGPGETTKGGGEVLVETTEPYPPWQVMGAGGQAVALTLPYQGAEAAHERGLVQTAQPLANCIGAGSQVNGRVDRERRIRPGEALILKGQEQGIARERDPDSDLDGVRLEEAAEGNNR